MGSGWGWGWGVGGRRVPASHGPFPHRASPTLRHTSSVPTELAQSRALLRLSTMSPYFSIFFAISSHFPLCRAVRDALSNTVKYLVAQAALHSALKGSEDPAGPTGGPD
jgi:hypothetical protein